MHLKLHSMPLYVWQSNCRLFGGVFVVGKASVVAWNPFYCDFLQAARSLIKVHAPPMHNTSRAAGKKLDTARNFHVVEGKQQTYIFTEEMALVTIY